MCLYVHSHLWYFMAGSWRGWKGAYMCVWVIEAKAVLIKVNPATGAGRSMQAYWSRPLGCGEYLAGKDSLVRRLTLIHWTLIRMALPGLDASVITVFVSRSPPSPILPPSFFIIVVRVEQSHQTLCAICLEEKFERRSCDSQSVCFIRSIVILIEYVPPSHILAHTLFIHPPTHMYNMYLFTVAEHKAYKII